MARDDEDAGLVWNELKVMPDYGRHLPVWGSLERWMPEGIETQDLRELGVSQRLIDRLLDWGRGWGWRAGRDLSLDEFAEGALLSVELARDLQLELPDFTIYLFDGHRPDSSGSGARSRSYDQPASSSICAMSSSRELRTRTASGAECCPHTTWIPTGASAGRRVT